MCGGDPRKWGGNSRGEAVVVVERVEASACGETPSHADDGLGTGKVAIKNTNRLMRGPRSREMVISHMVKYLNRQDCNLIGGSRDPGETEAKNGSILITLRSFE